jgi:hypothetical protein
MGTGAVMWIMLNDAFFSIVSKDCPRGSLLVRARRPGDIEKVFGRRVKVERSTDSDYLFRAAIPREDVDAAILGELRRIDYANFKDSVTDDDLHLAYLKVWTAMAAIQNPQPYSHGGLLRVTPISGKITADSKITVATKPKKGKK